MVRSLKGITKSGEPIQSIDSVQENAHFVEMFADEVKFLRSTNARLSEIVPALLRKLALPETHEHLILGGDAVGKRAEEGNTDQPSYHNQFHVSEVVVAAFCLGRRERIPPVRIAELLVAAAAHDLGHTGGMNKYEYELETRSYEIALPILQQAGWSEEELHRIWQMIVATDFRNGVPQVRQAYRDSRFLPADDETRLLSTQCLLLTEADILFSCFDTQYNDMLSQLLSAEWNRPAPNLSLKERVGFLNSVTFISSAAQQLGLEERRKNLVESLKAKIPPDPPPPPQT